MSEELNREQLVSLRQTLEDRLSDDDLRTLCFNLGVDYEDLPGQRKSIKIQELLMYFVRRKNISDLIEVGRRQRPDIPWPEISQKGEAGTSETEQVLGRLYAERADALSQLHDQMVDTKDHLSAWVYRDMPIGLSPPAVDEHEIISQVREIDRQSQKARIYLSDETNALLESTVDALKATMSALEQRDIVPDSEAKWELQNEALVNLDSFTQALDELNQEIRQILGATN